MEDTIDYGIYPARCEAVGLTAVCKSTPCWHLCVASPDDVSLQYYETDKLSDNEHLDFNVRKASFLRLRSLLWLPFMESPDQQTPFYTQTVMKRFSFSMYGSMWAWGVRDVWGSHVCTHTFSVYCFTQKRPELWSTLFKHKMTRYCGITGPACEDNSIK